MNTPVCLPKSSFSMTKERQKGVKTISRDLVFVLYPWEGKEKEDKKCTYSN